MNNKKVVILFIYVIFMILNSVIIFSFESHLWKYDKYIHFIEFFILGLLTINIFIKQIDTKTFIILFFLIICIAVFDEGIQYLIPSRIPDIYDLYYDIVGGFLGMFTLLLKENIYG